VRNQRRAIFSAGGAIAQKSPFLFCYFFLLAKQKKKVGTRATRAEKEKVRSPRRKRNTITINTHSMTSEKKLQAKNLYFQTELSKTQIATLLDISRRTLHYWIREGSWDRLKKSTEHMPSIIAENCYHIMAHLTESYLSERRLTSPVTHKEIDALHKLTLTINKLKNRSTLNESIEMFSYFVEKLKARAPKIAEEIAPIIDEYLSERASYSAQHFIPPHFNELGYIPATDNTDHKEQQLDTHDHFAWDTEQYNQSLTDQNSDLPPIPIPTEQETFESVYNNNQEVEKNVSLSPAEQSVILSPAEGCAGPQTESPIELPRRSLRGTKQSHETPFIHNTERARIEQKPRNAKPSQSLQSLTNQHFPTSTPLKKIFTPKLRNTSRQHRPL
jgi:transposase-like protein